MFKAPYKIFDIVYMDSRWHTGNEKLRNQGRVMIFAESVWDSVFGPLPL